MIFHDVQQNTEEWAALRLGKATASKFGSIMAFDICPVQDYITTTIGSPEHVNKSVLNYLSGKKLGSNQRNTVDWILNNLGSGAMLLNDLDVGVAITHKVSEMNLPPKDFGDVAHKYALQIALERINGRPTEFGFRNDDMERGHEQEPIARMLYEETHFVDVRNGGFFDCGETGDSPDGLINNDGVIEIKSVIASTHYATLQRGGFDPAYRWQLVGHLDCTGRDWVDFASYCADFPAHNQLLVYRMHRGDVAAELDRLRSRREMFLELVRATLVTIGADRIYSKTEAASTRR